MTVTLPASVRDLFNSLISTSAVPSILLSILTSKRSVRESNETLSGTSSSASRRRSSSTSVRDPISLNRNPFSPSSNKRANSEPPRLCNSARALSWSPSFFREFCPSSGVATATPEPRALPRELPITGKFRPITSGLLTPWPELNCCNPAPSASCFAFAGAVVPSTIVPAPFANICCMLLPDDLRISVPVPVTLSVTVVAPSTLTSAPVGSASTVIPPGTETSPLSTLIVSRSPACRPAALITIRSIEVIGNRRTDWPGIATLKIPGF